MRHLISGAAGFIGSHLCDSLLAGAHQVIGLDNLSSGSLKNLKHLETHTGFRFVQSDVTKPIALNESFDVVWHLASLPSPSRYLAQPIETLEVGALGTANMLNLARTTHARFILASTSECYGDPKEHPQAEEYWGNVNPIGPRSCYDEGKRYSEALTMAYHRKYHLRTSIARIFNTYGPRMAPDDGRVVPALINQALEGKPLTVHGTGQQTRSFCYISDLVEGLVGLMNAKEPEPINLGNPEEVTIVQLAERIRALVGSDSQIHHHVVREEDPQRRCPVIRRAIKVLGWRPRTSLDDGLRATIDYFRSIG